MVNSKVRQYTLNQAIILVVFCNLDFSILIFELSAKIRFRWLSRFPWFNIFNILWIIQNTQQGALIKLDIQRQVQTRLWLPIVLHYDNDIQCIISWFFCRQFYCIWFVNENLNKVINISVNFKGMSKMADHRVEIPIPGVYDISIALTVMSSSLNIMNLLHLNLKFIWCTEPTVGRLG